MALSLSLAQRMSCLCLCLCLCLVLLYTTNSTHYTVNAVPGLTLVLHLLGALSLLKALQRILSFIFVTFLRPGVSVRTQPIHLSFCPSLTDKLCQLNRFGARKGAWAGQSALPLLTFTHFQSRLLVITGASDGIGREFAIQLARAGFNLVLAARNQAKLDAVVDDIGAPTRPIPSSLNSPFSIFG
jgi:17beta-estradiol 17-dehydrogenase / very-long-chain 3-oxoacyl-CoA reductase